MDLDRFMFEESNLFESFVEDHGDNLFLDSFDAGHAATSNTTHAPVDRLGGFLPADFDLEADFDVYTGVEEDLMRGPLRHVTPGPWQHATNPTASDETMIHENSYAADRKRKACAKDEAKEGRKRQNKKQKPLVAIPSPTVIESKHQANNSSKSRRSPRNGNAKQTSSFRGVSCCGKDRKWQARIRDSNSVRYLGRFESEIEAALVYDESSRRLKGPSAPTNFVEMDEETESKLKIAFIRNNCTLPDEYLYLVSSKNKDTTKKATSRSPSPESVTSQRTKTIFDSPVAKITKPIPSLCPQEAKLAIQQSEFVSMASPVFVKSTTVTRINSGIELNAE